MPSNKLPFFIGLRYSFSRKDNRFIGVVSMVSLLGMALGVASLITVLSVMNGFAGELRDRILSLVPHLQVEAHNGALQDWRGLASRLQQHPQVLAAAPFIDSKVLMSGNHMVRGSLVSAIDVDAEALVSELSAHLHSGSFEALKTRRYGIVLGVLQARALGVELEDTIELTVPRLTHTPLGSFPRRKRFTVVGLFEVGAQLDGTHSYVSLHSAQKLLGMGAAVDGLRLRGTDLFDAPAIAAQLQQQLGPDYRVRDWGQSQGSLFGAIKMEKVMMTVLLMTVVAVAAFNIVSTLIMAVTDKRSDIAVLRTMGASASSIMAIFVTQGLYLAMAGITAGGLIGVLLALNISEATLFLENLLGLKFFNPDVYFISDLPSRLQLQDVLMVTSLAAALSLLATLFPAWRATRIAPAEVLRYE